MKINARIGRLLKAGKDVLFAYKKLVEVESFLASELDLLDPSKLTGKDAEKVTLLRKRTFINYRQEPLLKESFKLSRMKDQTQEEAQLTETVKELKEHCFQVLKDMPDIGYTKSDWAKLDSKDKAQPLGRPGVSTELQLIRAKRELVGAIDNLNLFQENAVKNNDLNQDDINNIKGLFGVFPLTVESVLENHEIVLKRKNPGRKQSGAEISKMMRRVSKMDKEIEYYESGQAEIDQKAEVQHRIDNNLPIGRPYMSKKDKLESLYKRKQELMSEASKREKELSPSAYIEHRIVNARNKIKRLKAEIEENEIVVSRNKRHPLVIELNKANEIHDTIVSYRNNPEMYISLEGNAILPNNKVDLNDLEDKEEELNLERPVESSIFDEIYEDLNRPNLLMSFAYHAVGKTEMIDSDFKQLNTNQRQLDTILLVGSNKSHKANEETENDDSNILESIINTEENDQSNQTETSVNVISEPVTEQKNDSLNDLSKEELNAINERNEIIRRNVMIKMKARKIKAKKEAQRKLDMENKKPSSDTDELFAIIEKTA